MNEWLYLLVFVVLLAVLLLYLSVAPKWGLFDTPNERSSHVNITTRGAGVIFPMALVLDGLFSGFASMSLLLGGIVLGVLSFVDDVRNLSARFRLLVHLAIISWCLVSFQVDNTHLWLLPFAGFYFLWMMNAYNFMDGINGITGLNTVSHLLALLWLNSTIHFTENELLFILLIATGIFLFFNFRVKAICFLGDVGSIPLGFVLVALTIQAIVQLNDLNPLVFFAVYMVDSGWTIAQRLIAKENIFKPHRKHLYQLLVNEYKWSHLVVSGMYFIVQIAINALYFSFSWDKHVYLLLIIGVLSVAYLLIKRRLMRAN